MMRIFTFGFVVCSCFGQKHVTVPANTTSLQSFISANNGATISIPAGNYLLSNAKSASGLSLNGFTGELDFAAGAKLLCNTTTVSAGWCVNIQNSTNLVIRGIWVGYSSEAGLPLPRASATNGAMQIWNCSNVSVYSPHIDASTGLGLIFGASTNVNVNQAQVLNTTADGLSFINDSAATLNGLYASKTGDDGLSVINYAFYGNNTGFTGTNIQSYGSAARGISVPGQSNVSISNFYVANAAKSGIITQTDFAFDTRRPSKVSWSNGTIVSSGLYGIQTDAADNVSYSNVKVSSSGAGGWYACTSACNNISGTNLSFTLGGGGSGFYLGAVNTGQFSGISISDNPTYGFYITGSSNVTFANLQVTDVSQKDSLGRAWWAESNTGSIAVNGLLVVDNQSTPTGYVVGEYENNLGPVIVTNISGEITSGQLSIQQTSSDATFELSSTS